MSETARKVYLTGIGPGDLRGMTLQAEEVITAADCLIGADRMLSCAEAVLSGDGSEGNGRKENDREGNDRKATGHIPRLCEYRPGEICAYIGSHPEYRRIVVLLSGDTGFYSGAKKLGQALKERFPDLSVEMIPGISSIVYLAAKLETSWEDGALVSLHGQEEDFISTVNRNRKTFLLLGGSQSGKYMTDRLKEFGMDQVILHCGTRLSYPDERILSGSLDDLSKESFSGLSTVLIENPRTDRRASSHIRDEEMIRGNVPMTKEEVRSVSMAKLELTEGAVLWDVGAGTGSVSVEAALSGKYIRVYAVEKKDEAVDLIRQNRIKFRADGIRIICGEAPEALQDLEPPTHLFIGGSSGSMQEILHIALEKNPDVRIVINAISLETVGEVMEAVESGMLRDEEIVQLCVSRSRTLGRYHMMTGQNPVYIISAGGPQEKGTI